MEIHVFYTGLIVIGLLCLLAAGLIWVLFVATDPNFAAVKLANNDVDDVLNAELDANQRLLERDFQSAREALHPVVHVRADEAEIAPGVM